MATQTSAVAAVKPAITLAELETSPTRANLLKIFGAPYPLPPSELKPVPGLETSWHYFPVTIVKNKAPLRLWVPTAEAISKLDDSELWLQAGHWQLHLSYVAVNDHSNEWRLRIRRPQANSYVDENESLTRLLQDAQRTIFDPKDDFYRVIYEFRSFDEKALQPLLALLETTDA